MRVGQKITGRRMCCTPCTPAVKSEVAFSSFLNIIDITASKGGCVSPRGVVQTRYVGHQPISLPFLSFLLPLFFPSLFFLPSTSLPSFSLPPLPLPSSPIPLEAGPFIAASGPGGALFPSGSGRNPADKRYLVNFGLKISPLVTTIFRSFSGNETSN